MTSNSSKVTRNNHAGQTFSSEESDRRGRKKQHQKITIPIVEKKTIQEVKLWWRIFIQDVKMTQDIDFTTITNDREILSRYRDELRVKIKNKIIWTLCEAEVTEMIKTVRVNDPNKMSLNQLYSLFRLHFILEINKLHSSADFFWYHLRTN